jgi:endoglucanase
LRGAGDVRPELGRKPKTRTERPVIFRMTPTRLRPLAFVWLSVFVACASGDEIERTTSTAPSETMGAELPSEGAPAPQPLPSPTSPQPPPQPPAPASTLIWPAPTITGPAPTTTAPMPKVPPPETAPAPIVPAPTTTVVPYRGINLAGAEFGSSLPGTDGTDYSFPTHAEVDYYLAKGMSTFRIGFKWERLQRAAYGAFDASYAAKLDDITQYAASKGATVVLNPHNFARYYGNPVGSTSVPNAVFSDFWRRLSSKYISHPRVMFNLVNEPHTMPTEQWVSAANAAIAAIRATSAKNTIIVPGNGWTGAHSWTSTWYGTSNAVAMLNIVDSADNLLFEAHQYLDADSSGSSDQCVSTTIGSERLAAFVKWLRDNGKKGFIGELAGGRNATCYSAINNMVSYMMAQSDVLVGWLWWAGGPRWGNYQFTLEPSAGTDQPMMGVLAPFLFK